MDINFVGIQQGCWLIEIIGNLENKGLIPYNITNLGFDAKYLLAEDNLDENENAYHGQINIKNILKAQSWLAHNQEKPALINPGIKMRYNYIYKVNTTSSFILIHGLLDYGNGLQTRADKLVRVPKKDDKILE